MKKLMMLFIAICLIAGTSACKEKEYIHVGPNWAAVNDIESSEKGFRVRVTGKQDLKLGEELTFEVTSDKSGKLWVVQVDPEDNVTLLFPNEKSKVNAVSAANPFNVPPKGATWRIEATKPAGKSVVAFIVTTGDTDLQDVLGQKGSMTKALRLMENGPSWGVGKLVIDVK